MNKVKYQIFVSSTYHDLIDQRTAVVRAVLEMGHIPVGMEMFSAGDEAQWATIKRQIDEIDYYVVILAHRYGSRDGPTSYTEKEYDYAVSKKIPILAFVVDPATDWSPDFMDKKQEDTDALGDFKNKLQTRMVGSWANATELAGKVTIALMKAITHTPRPGWVHASSVAGPEVTAELTRLSAENAKLRQTVDDLLAGSTQATDERDRGILRAIRSTGRDVFFRKTSKDDWEELEQNTTLYEIFVLIAPTMMVEQSLDDVSLCLGFHLVQDKTVIRKVPLNSVQEWLADLMAMELITPSSRKHAVSDKNEYWTLSEIGNRIWKSVRRDEIVFDKREDPNSEKTKRPAKSMKRTKKTKKPRRAGR